MLVLDSDTIDEVDDDEVVLMVEALLDEFDVIVTTEVIEMVVVVEVDEDDELDELDEIDNRERFDETDEYEWRLISDEFVVIILDDDTEYDIIELV